MKGEPAAAPPVAMQCMEIRGGSRAVDEAIATPGLTGRIFSQPYESAESGGDCYYVSLCGGGIVTRLIVADVSGHGARVAQFSEFLRGLMRKHINAKSQTRLVEALNREFGAMAQLQKFATAVVATYLANKRTLTVCNAGHPRPLLHEAASKSWSVLDKELTEPGNLPLGLDDDSPYRQFTVALKPGDAVLVYTDALTEAADPSGRMLGEEGLLELARGIDPADPRGIGPALLEAVDCHRAGRPADDDVTLLALMHNGEGPRRLSIGEKAHVYAKFFGLEKY